MPRELCSQLRADLREGTVLGAGGDFAIRVAGVESATRSCCASLISWSRYPDLLSLRLTFNTLVLVSNVVSSVTGAEAVRPDAKRRTKGIMP